MSKNIRIRTEVNGTDNALKVQLNQDFDFLEILSLKLNQEDIYRTFYADYGVIVGRVIINNGVGVPNAKISIFIPLTDDDSEDPEIAALYPYTDLTVVNSDGIRYNSLPEDPQNECHTPVGTFPSKNKLIDNPKLLEVYDKYYKYSTTTNSSGDFMLFGVPVGNHTINVDVDLSDIGRFSQRPYDFIEQGNPSKLFESSTKFKGGYNLNNLTQLKNSQVSVNVIPFWGESVGKEIGISRIDVDLNYNLVPKAIFIGSIFGDNEKNSVNKNCRPRRNTGKVCEMAEGGGTIQMLRKTIYGENERFDIEGGKVIDDNGAWAYQIPMNLDYMITDEYGDLVPTDDTTKGIPTRSSIRFKIDMDVSGGEGRLRTRAKYLVPHNPSNQSEVNYTFDDSTPDIHFRDFSWNKIYTIKNHISRYQPNDNLSNRNFVGFKDVDDCPGTKNPIPFNTIDGDLNPLYFILCIIITAIISIVAAINKFLDWLRDIKFLGIRPFKKLNLIPIKCPNGEVFYPITGKSSYENTLECYQISLAESLGVFEFDFYNDWVNGALYSYLLKYKKVKKEEKFCGDDDTSGNYYLLSTTEEGQTVTQESTAKLVDEGLIVSYDSELFYRPISDNNYLLNATDIYNLGSVFNCDWQDVPKISESLIPSTYQIPVLTTDDEETVSEIDPLLFDIGCTGIKVDTQQSINIRRLCEIGVNIDEDVNYQIDLNDIDDGLLRRNLLKLNTDNYGNTLINNIDTSFVSNDYKNYRDTRNVGGITQNFGNSYYFYFGTSPNNSALDLMNSKYFTTCAEVFINDIIIVGEIIDVTTVNGTDGSISIEVNGGTPEYTYEWVDSDQLLIGVTQNINNLTKGVYTVTVMDANGITSKKTFNVRGVEVLSMTITTRQSLPTLDGDGIIYVNYINGGIGPYTVELVGVETKVGIYRSTEFLNITNGTYTVNVTDTNNQTISQTVSINEVTTLEATYSKTDLTCINYDNGTITVFPTGGTEPYYVELTSDDDYVYTNEVNTDLSDGVYSLVVKDSYNQTTTPVNITINNVPELEFDATNVTTSGGTLTLSNAIIGETYYLEYDDLTNEPTVIHIEVATSSTITYTAMAAGDYTFESDTCRTDVISIGP